MSILRLLSFCAIAVILTACGGGGGTTGVTTGTPPGTPPPTGGGPPPPVNPGPPGSSPTTFYLPYQAASNSGGETGLFVIPSDNLSTAPTFVTRTTTSGPSGIAILASSEKQTLDSAHVVTAVSPYALLYLAAGSDGNTHVYSVTLDNTSMAPHATQISSLSLSSPSDLCSVVGQAQTNVYDPTTLFVVLRTNAGGTTGCGTGDTYQVVHLSDTPTTAPSSVSLNVGNNGCLPVNGQLNAGSLAVLKALYQPGGALGGLVLADSVSSNLNYYADSTFTKPTTLVAGVQSWCSLVDDSSVNNTGFVGASVAFLSVTTNAGTSVWRVTGAGASSAANVYTANGILGTSGVADSKNIYFTDLNPLIGTKVYEEPISGGNPLELYEAASAGLPIPPTYSLIGSNGTTLVLTSSTVSLTGGPAGVTGGKLSASLLALPVGTAGTPKTIAGPFTGVLAASLCEAKWADPTSALVVVNVQEFDTSNPLSSYAYSSEILTPDGTVKLPALDNSYFVSILPTPLSQCGDKFGSLLQVRGITDKGGGYGGSTVNVVDLNSFTVTTLTTKTGSGSYSIPSGDSLLGLFSANTIGSGVLGSGLTSLGVAFDLSKSLIVTVGVPSSSVTSVPIGGP